MNRDREAMKAEATVNNGQTIENEQQNEMTYKKEGAEDGTIE